MNPEDLAKSGSEHGHQSAFFCWASQRVGLEPKLKLLFAVPNGGTRGSDPKSRAIAGAMLKAEGVKTGVPDIILPVARRGYHGLYIELKKLEKWSTSAAQKAWREDLTAEGYLSALCLGWQQAVDCVKWYLEREDL